MQLSYSVIADGVLILKTIKQSKAIQFARRMAQKASTVTLEASNGFVLHVWRKT